MKTIFTIILILTLCLSARAQYLELSAGIKDINVEKGVITFIYIDESPAPDILLTQITLKGGRTALSIGIDYEGFKDINKLYLLFRIHGYFGEISGGDIGLGVGYPLYLTPSGKVRLHPEISLITGLNQKRLGALNVEAAGSIYITVNSTQYADYTSVNTTLQNTYLSVRPGIKAAIQINDRMDLRLFAGYHLGKGSSSVSFSGTISNGEIKAETEKITEENVYFDVDGISTSKAPFWASGWEFRGGLAFRL